MQAQAVDIQPLFRGQTVPIYWGFFQKDLRLTKFVIDFRTKIVR